MTFRCTAQSAKVVCKFVVLLAVYIALPNAIKPITALLSGVALLLMGSGLINTLLILRGSYESFSSIQIGLLTSCYFAGFLAGSFVSPGLLRRAGYIRTFAFCVAILSSSTLVSGLWINVWFWCLLRFCNGMALVVLYGLIESWLNGQTAPTERGMVFGSYMLVNLGALALTQQFFTFLPVNSGLLFICAALLMNLSLLPVTMTRLPQPEVAERIRPDIFLVFQAAPAAAAGAICSGLAMGAFWGMLALFASEQMPTSQVGMFISIAILGGALFQIPLGRFSDRFDRRRVLMFAASAGALSAILMLLLSLLLSGYILPIILATFIYSGFAFTIYPLSVAHLIDQVQAEQLIPVSSALLVMHGVCSAIGPILGAKAISLLGYQGLPLYFFLIQGLLATLLVLCIRYNPRLILGQEQTGHFMPMLRTGVNALEIHPDAISDSEEPIQREPS